MDLNRREDIIKRFISSHAEWKRVAEVQLKAGDINQSTYQSVLLQLQQFYFQRTQLDADRYSLVQQLNLLLGTKNDIAPQTESVPLTDFKFEIINSSHPLLQASEAKIKESLALVEIEKNRLSPDLNIGYSNLSIKGWQSPDGVSQKYYGTGDRFGIFQLGLSFPLFNGSAKAKVQAAQSNYELVNLEGQQKQLQLEKRWLDVSYRFYKAKEAFDYYQKEGIPTAISIAEQTRLRLQSGDINFAERIMLETQQLQAFTAHADAILQLQLALAEYQYLSEKK
jgi:cobalt-zinc-cadmium resistance protein CzcA